MDGVVCHGAQGTAAVGDNLTIPGKCIQLIHQFQDGDGPGRCDVTLLVFLPGTHIQEYGLPFAQA